MANETPTPCAPCALLASAYRDALLAQGACNLGGLVHGWSAVMGKLQAEARVHGHGTDWLNAHPINRLFAEQVWHLTGSGRNYASAYRACEEGAKHAAG